MLLDINSSAHIIAELAIRSMLYEISAYPSPGLVSPVSTGAHKDMNFYTFLNSCPVLLIPIAVCAQIGAQAANPALIMPDIRKIGIAAEKRMYKATGGVNTQKGHLFLGGIIAAAAGYLLIRQGYLKADDIFSVVAEICSKIVEQDFAQLQKKEVLTRGEQFYIQIGVTGIRGEVEQGLPSIRTFGLPGFYQAREAQLNLNDCIIHTLVALMQQTEDTNIIGRFSLQVLHEIKLRSRAIMKKGGMLTAVGRKAIVEMDRELSRDGISPGGSADLTAATVFIYLLENEFT